ncbi:MAG: hypothetical protein AAFP96_10460 [Bacteroidota bacterium]
MKSYVFLLLLLIACAKRMEKPYVQAVYPTSSALPENLLRMYVHFSQPMKTVGNIEKIKLVDEEGNKVENVFFNNVHELWNKEQTQLTLILDPARIKTGLKVNESFGRAIEAGKNYDLIIANLENIYHEKMVKSFQKRLTVEEADVIIPKLENWKLTVPKTKSTTSFVVEFPQILDYNSLRERLIITDNKNLPIEGVVFIKNEETKWSFQPKGPWKSGDYILYVNTRLEDPAGNNLNGLFDHKSGNLKYNKEGVTKKISFTIRP